ncbi:MAG: alkaline phosphatase family protein [Desulfobacterales bacterium]
MDNDWISGEVTVQKPTIFDSAQRNGFKTGYFYSKEKLGYLVNDAVNVHEWSRDSAIDSAGVFIKTTGRHFVFLHISGLDQVGPEYGWLSPEYIEELSYIDDYLSSLINSISDEKNYLIIVISDLAGHEKVHGSDHLQDYRLPLIVCSDTVAVKRFQDIPFSVIELKKSLEDLVENAP